MVPARLLGPKRSTIHSFKETTLPDNLDLQRLQIQGLCDYHVHCDYSIDATGTIDEYCEAALQRGLAEICFTTHFDTIPDSNQPVNIIRVNGEELPTSIDNLAPYVDEVQRASHQFYPLGLSVRLGLEFGWYRGCEETIMKLRERYPIEHLLCGFHELDGFCFASKREADQAFAKYAPEEFVAAYYKELTAAATTGLFDAIAHAAYYLRYGPAYYKKDMLDLHQKCIEPFFEGLVATNTALEINTSGIRHGHAYYYPTALIINQAKRMGVRVNFLGSDAHHPSQIGLDFEIASAMIPSAIRNCESD